MRAMHILGLAACLSGAGPLASPASAVPRDVVTFTNIASSGERGAPTNELRVFSIAQAYVASRLVVSATLSKVAPSTWGSDSRILVTAPNGVETVVQPFSVASFEGNLVVAGLPVDIAMPLGHADGEWSFRFFEAYADDPGSVDALWNSITIQFDDTADAVGWYERVDAGEDPHTTQACIGEGPLPRVGGVLVGADVDLYTIDICTPALFSASTEGRAEFDTQPFLFRQDGTGVEFNDDSPGQIGLQSTLTSEFVVGAGRYVLGISQFNRKPLDEQGLAMWVDEPGRAVRIPDGPGAGGRLSSWASPSLGPGGHYEIVLQGACFIPQSQLCPADLDNGTGTGVPDGAVEISDLLFFLGAYEAGDTHADLDDGSFTGVLDGAVDINDLLYFIQHYLDGC